ncbi:MAG: glycosyltransferase, partial [Acidocella sp.]|nr:glycosyltransferase [Acidocella sp.]
MRVLLISQYHPEIVRGGAQTMAYELFHGLRANAGIAATLLASADHLTPALFKSGTRITGFDGKPDEFLFLSQGYDHVWNKSGDVALAEAFAAFLSLIQPEIVHFHHFVTLGIDFLTLTRRVLPTARIIFTAHEFLTICAANGHMLRLTNQSLCSYASPLRCHQCLPGHSPEHYFTRDLWMKAHLSVVDHFTVPSRFMIDIFARWGLPRGIFSVVVNGLDLPPPKPDIALTRPRHRFGFFGQLIDSKGVHLILDAVDILRAQGFTAFTVEINGDNIQFASDDCRAKIETWLARESDLPFAERNVVFNGAYHPDQLAGLMARVDWCLVPSLWWEVFCLVISE